MKARYSRKVKSRRHSKTSKHLRKTRRHLQKTRRFRKTGGVDIELSSMSSIRRGKAAKKIQRTARAKAARDKKNPLKGLTSARVAQIKDAMSLPRQRGDGYGRSIRF